MKNAISKIIRVCTLASFLALVLLTTLYFCVPNCMSLTNYVMSIVFLVLLPIIAYPIQPIVPHFKDRGRDGQRTLAMIAAVVGYVLSIIYAAVSRAPLIIWEIYLTYLLSGITILVINKLFHFKASGHACGIAGPTCMLAFYIGLPAIIVGGAIYLLALGASLRMDRHTIWQFLGGTAIPIVIYLLLRLIGI